MTPGTSDDPPGGPITQTFTNGCGSRLAVVAPARVGEVMGSAANRAAPADPQPDQQDDDRTDEGTNDPRGLQETVLGVLVENDVAQKPADERPDNTQDDRHQDRDVLSAGHDEAGQRAGDQTDDDDADDETQHDVPSCHCTSETRAPDQTLTGLMINILLTGYYSNTPR